MLQPKASICRQFFWHIYIYNFVWIISVFKPSSLGSGHSQSHHPVSLKSLWLYCSAIESLSPACWHRHWSIYIRQGSDCNSVSTEGYARQRGKSCEYCHLHTFDWLYTFFQVLPTSFENLYRIWNLKCMRNHCKWLYIFCKNTCTGYKSEMLGSRMWQKYCF